MSGQNNQANNDGTFDIFNLGSTTVVDPFAASAAMGTPQQMFETPTPAAHPVQIMQPAQNQAEATTGEQAGQVPANPLATGLVKKIAHPNKCRKCQTGSVGAKCPARRGGGIRAVVFGVNTVGHVCHTAPDDGDGLTYWLQRTACATAEHIKPLGLPVMNKSRVF